MLKRQAASACALAAVLALLAGGQAFGQGKKGDTELVMVYVSFGTVPQDLAKVQDALNKITSAKIGATVKMVPINIGSFDQQTNLMLTSDEPLDLLFTGGYRLTGAVAKGQLQPMDELLATYGDGIVKAVGKDYLEAGRINGKVYAVPTIRDFAQEKGLNMRKDILDKYKIDPKTIKTFDDVERLFKLIKEKEPDMTPTMPNAATASILEYAAVTYDPLGDSLGVLLNKGADTKVVNWYATEDYKAWLKRVRSWYKAGYILKDVATNKDNPYVYIKANKLFSYIGYRKPGTEMQETNNAGQPIVSIQLQAPYAYTQTVSNVMWAIARNSKHPDKALQLLNLLYSDPQVVNLIDWGIEGQHYVKMSDGHIDFPKGVDANNTTYAMNMGWQFGNQFLSYIWKGDDLGLWKDMEAFNKSAVKSKAMGFTMDTSPVKTEIAAVTNVQNQYRLALEDGVLDPDENLPVYLQKLKDAGMDRIIAEKQKQLDAWLAGRK